MPAGSVRPTTPVTAWAVLGTSALAIAIVLGARWGPDWPAQEFRTWVAVHDGLAQWTQQWYSGTSLPGYSLLFPVVAATFGLAAPGVGAVLVITWAAMEWAPTGRWHARAYALAVGGTVSQNLLTGQIPFLLGTAAAVVAVRLVARGRSGARSGAAALLSSMFSPLAGASLLLLAPMVVAGTGVRRAAPLLSALVAIGASAAIGGSSGWFPFPWPTLAAVLVFCTLLAVLPFGPRRELRVLAACYLLAALVLFFVPNAIGGNIARVGKLLALPLAVRLVPLDRRTSRRAIGAAMVALAAVWPAPGTITAVVRGLGDQTGSSEYYAGLSAFLRTQDPRAGRLEIPFTQQHWESFFVATSFPIARGWDRQLDLQHNAVLYEPLTAATYRRWLDDNAVSLVALPHAALDAGGKAEAALLRTPPDYLVPAWSDADWTVWRVRAAQPMALGAARIVALGSDSVQLYFARAGDAVIRIHADPMWSVSAGAACVTVDQSDGWLHVRAVAPGSVTLHAGLGLHEFSDPAGCAQSGLPPP